MVFLIGLDKKETKASYVILQKNFPLKLHTKSYSSGLYGSKNYSDWIKTYEVITAESCIRRWHLLAARRSLRC
jgi:hypothetical protein